jgi:cytochrome c oxidase subunit 4
MDNHSEHHIVDYGTYILIWLTLLIFTGITITSAGINFAKIGIVIALFIASVKTTLVLFYFMHLKYEAKLFKIMFIITIATLTVFIGITFFDVLFR